MSPLLSTRRQLKARGEFLGLVWKGWGQWRDLASHCPALCLVGRIRCLSSWSTASAAGTPLNSSSLGRQAHHMTQGTGSFSPPPSLNWSQTLQVPPQGRSWSAISVQSVLRDGTVSLSADYSTVYSLFPLFLFMIYPFRQPSGRYNKNVCVLWVTFFRLGY